MHEIWGDVVWLLFWHRYSFVLLSFLWRGIVLCYCVAVFVWVKRSGVCMMWYTNLVSKRISVCFNVSCLWVSGHVWRWLNWTDNAVLHIEIKLNTMWIKFECWNCGSIGECIAVKSKIIIFIIFIVNWISQVNHFDLAARKKKKRIHSLWIHSTHKVMWLEMTEFLIVVSFFFASAFCCRWHNGGKSYSYSYLLLFVYFFFFLHNLWFHTFDKLSGSTQWMM